MKGLEAAEPSINSDEVFAQIDVAQAKKIDFQQFQQWWAPQAAPLHALIKKTYFKTFLSNLTTSADSALTQPKVLARIEEGDIFGELSFLEGSAASASVIADSDQVVLYCMEGQVLNHLFEWKPELAARFDGTSLYMSLC